MNITELLRELAFYLEREAVYGLSPAESFRKRHLLSRVRDALAEREACAGQAETNERWLISMIDRIHAALCPGKSGTWQMRAEQAVEAAVHYAEEAAAKMRAWGLAEREQPMRVEDCDTCRYKHVEIHDDPCRHCEQVRRENLWVRRGADQDIPAEREKPRTQMLSCEQLHDNIVHAQDALAGMKRMEV